MALIKTLKDFLSRTPIYPTTKTNAVYDDEVGRLDTFLHNTLGAEEVDDIEGEEVELRDADTLGGRYTAEDLDMMPKSEIVEDYAQVEPPIVDADYLGGKKASDYALDKEVKEHHNWTLIVDNKDITTITYADLQVNKYSEYYMVMHLAESSSYQSVEAMFTSVRHTSRNLAHVTYYTSGENVSDIYLVGYCRNLWATNIFADVKTWNITKSRLDNLMVKGSIWAR